MKTDTHPSLIALLTTLASPVLAQTSFLYKWQFQDTSLQTTIPTCEPLNVIITSFDTTTNKTKGTPPYYMTAYAIDGVPATTLLGTTEENAKFTVTYPVGTKLLLSVTDSQGNPGGTFAPMTVAAGKSTSCTAQPSGLSNFKLTTNITSEISTCDPLGLTISGGTSPYIVSLVPSNAPAVTNVTLPSGDDVYTYINRASPGGELIVAVSDSNGNWASGTPLLETTGAADTTCNNLVSSSSKSAGGSTGGSSDTNSSSTAVPNSTSKSNSPATTASSGTTTSSGTSSSSNNGNGSSGSSNKIQKNLILAACIAVGSLLVL